MSQVKQHKFQLDESEMPTRWYNVLHDLPTPPPPVLHPGTGQPVGPDDLAPLVPDGPDPARGLHRAVRRHPGGGARRLPAVAAEPPVSRTSPGEGARHAGADLLQVRGRLAGRLAQDEHRGSAGVLQRPGRDQAADHGDRSRPVGHGAGLRLRAVRPRLRGLAGAGVLRPEAVPADDDRDVRRHRAPQPLDADRGRPRDPRRAPRLDRLVGDRDQRGRRGRGAGPDHQLLARQRAQPRADAPDDHRRGGAAPARPGR